MCSGAGGNFSGLGPFMVTGRWPQEESVIYPWDMHEESGAEKFNDFPSDSQEGSGRHNILLQEYLDKGLKVSFFKSPSKLLNGHLHPVPEPDSDPWVRDGGRRETRCRTRMA